jgi:hypothetical protein
MDLIALLIDFILGLFVLVALGQLFSINASLKRLVQLAERAPASIGSATSLTAPNTPATLGEMNDNDLMAKWKATGDAGALQELKARGYYMG